MNIYLDIDGTIKNTAAPLEDVIDFQGQFIWLDDMILQAKRNALEANNADIGFFQVEPKDPQCLKDALEYIKEICAIILSPSLFFRI